MYIESMAACSGLHAVDVALGIAGVLANVAGPYAGLQDATGGRVQPHLSLLRIGSTTPRMHALEARLFHPLRIRTNWLRQSASSHSRSLADKWVFGEHTRSPDSHKKSPGPCFLQERRGQAASQQEKLLTERGLDPNVFNETDSLDYLLNIGRAGDPVRTSPGPVHLPSLFFDGLALERLAAAMNESIHREALLFMPSGGVFDQSPGRSSADDQLAAVLVGLLRGRDSQFAPLHADQGPGTFERARVHLWAAMTLERLSETLAADSSSWSDLYKHCLLWDVAAWKTPENKKPNAAPAWLYYDRQVHDLLNLRCFGKLQRQMRLPIPAAYEPCFNRTQNVYLEELEKLPAADRTLTAQFHDLPARLFWVFMQFRGKGEGFWCGKAAFNTALYAAQMHVRLVREAREQYAARENQEAEERVVAILVRKGPCKVRDMQRATNNRSAAFFKPALRTLEQQGRLRVDENKRFQLVGQS